MLRNECWSFVPFVSGQPVLVVTCPRLIHVLLSPFFKESDVQRRSYGDYIDPALATALTDQAPGIYGGIATGAAKPQHEPFPHARLSVEIDRAKPHTATKPVFDRSARAVAGRAASPPAWVRRRAPGEWSDPVRFGFLGIALPDDHMNRHLLTSLLNLASRAVELETRLELG